MGFNISLGSKNRIRLNCTAQTGLIQIWLLTLCRFLQSPSGFPPLRGAQGHDDLPSLVLFTIGLGYQIILSISQKQMEPNDFLVLAIKVGPWCIKTSCENYTFD